MITPSASAAAEIFVAGRLPGAQISGERRGVLTLMVDAQRKQFGPSGKALDTAVVMAADTIAAYIQNLPDGIRPKQTADARLRAVESSMVACQ
jgi:hypothetical protein